MRMIKRILISTIFIISFIIFYFLISYSLYSKFPFLFSGLFALITVFLFGLTLFNVGSLKELKALRQKNKNLRIFWIVGFLVYILLTAVFFIIFLLNFEEKEMVEFAINSEETHGTLIDKWTEKTTPRYNTYILTHIKISYKVGDRLITSEKITDQDSINTNIGETFTIYYSKSNPEMYETKWERKKRENPI